VVVACLKYYAV